jgi:DNA-directed RNA polymerase specialized sigma54-like protein
MVLANPTVEVFQHSSVIRVVRRSFISIPLLWYSLKDIFPPAINRREGRSPRVDKALVDIEDSKR